MDARLLLIVFDAAYLIAMTAWVGGLMFSRFNQAGQLSKTLDPDSAARLSRTLTPAAYSWGMNWAAIALASLVCGRLTHQEYRGASVLLQALPLVAVILSMVHGSQSLSPGLARAIAAGPSGTERLQRLQRQRGFLDGVNLVIGLALLIAFAARPAPKTPGIIEPTPVQRTIIEQNALSRNRRNAQTAQPNAAPNGAHPAPGAAPELRTP